MGLPLVTIEGRVVADPELRFSPSGTAVGSFRMVSASRKQNPETKEWEDDRLLWMGVTAFKQLAENVAESVAKGDMVVVTGRLYTDEWTSTEGEKRTAVKMNADTVSVSLQWRTVPHGGGRTERTSAPSETKAAEPAGLPQSEDPPFNSGF